MNRRGIVLLSVALAIISGSARSLDEIISILTEPCNRHACIEFEMSNESSSPVSYGIELWSLQPSDTFSVCDYLIEWRHGDSTLPDGFNSYGDGVHFRYNHNRLHEYHYVDDPALFTGSDGGIQSRALFVNLLPPCLGRELASYVADTACTILFDGKTNLLTVTRNGARSTGWEITARFDSVTGLPISIERLNNPGLPFEQLTTVKYRWDDTSAGVSADENYLSRRYPEIFERFRVKTLSAPNLVGTALPSFSVRTPTNNRISHNLGEPLGTPTVIIFSDESPVDDKILSKVRREFPGHFIWVAYSDKGEPIPGANTLVKASSLHRDCGITACPTLMVLDVNSIIRQVILP